MSKRIPIADAVIVENERFFVVKRGAHPRKGMYTFPGGKVAFEESYNETVVREVYEETGLHIESSKEDFIGAVAIEAKGLIGTVHFVRARIIGGEIKLLENEIVDYKWITLEEYIKGHSKHGFSKKAIKEIRETVGQALQIQYS